MSVSVEYSRQASFFLSRISAGMMRIIKGHVRIPWSDKIEQIGQRCLTILNCWRARQEIISQEQSIIDELRPIGENGL